MKTCVAPGCKVGYRKQKDGKVVKREKKSLFCFPNPKTEKKRLEDWLKAIPRAHFTPTTNSRLCELHFAPTDFVKDSEDKNLTRFVSS